MVRALTVQKRDGTILYLQMHDIIAHIIQVIVVCIQRQSLGDAIAKIDGGLQAAALAAVCCAHAEIQRCCQHKDHCSKDQVLHPWLQAFGAGSVFRCFAGTHAA